jgi:hypothetical protein
MPKKSSGTTGKKRGSTNSRSASKEIDAIVNDLPAWQGSMLARIRRVILAADPKIIEEVKWKKPSNPAGVPIWSRDGIICTGEAHTKHLRFTFAQGAALDDPDGVFNSGFAGRVLRAVVLREGDAIDEKAFQSLVRAAAALNATTVND